MARHDPAPVPSLPEPQAYWRTIARRCPLCGGPLYGSAGLEPWYLDHLGPTHRHCASAMDQLIYGILCMEQHGFNREQQVRICFEAIQSCENIIQRTASEYFISIYAEAITLAFPDR